MFNKKEKKIRQILNIFRPKISPIYSSFSKTQDEITLSTNLKMTQKSSSSLEKKRIFYELFQIHEIKHDFIYFQNDGQNSIN